MAFHVGAFGGRNGGQRRTGSVRGGARAAARCAPQGLRRSCRSGRDECPAGVYARPAERAIRYMPCPERDVAREHMPDGRPARPARP